MSELWYNLVGCRVKVVLVNGEVIVGTLQQIGKKQIIISREGVDYYITLNNVLYYHEV